MPRAVVLRHDLPDGSHHFDWLFEPEPEPNPEPGSGLASDPDECVLVSWRVPVAPQAAAGAVEADRMQAHRRVYLEYEGEVSGGRGSVTRVAEGEAQILVDAPDRFEAIARFGGTEFTLSAAPRPAGGWILTIQQRAIDG